jgi:adenylate kinase
VDIVVGLEVEEEELIVRLINRGKTSGRSDDNLETIKKRLDVYNSQTNVLRDHYMSQGKYEAVHGMGSIEDIFATIKTLVEKHRR